MEVKREASESGVSTVVSGTDPLDIGVPETYGGGWLVSRGLVSLCLLCKI